MAKLKTRGIIDVILTDESPGRCSPEVERERSAALRDLLRKNDFILLGTTGPYKLHIAVHEHHLAFSVHSADDTGLCDMLLSLTPFDEVVKDYRSACERYYAAIAKAHSPTDAVDRRRRGLHIKGSNLLRELLASKIEIDQDTAQIMFSLICALHVKV